MRDDPDPLADLIELQPAWVKTFDLPGGDGAEWTIFPNSDSVEIRAEMVQPTVNLWSFGVWYWPEALAVVLALLVLVTGQWWWFARKGKEPRCRKCGYELTGLKSEACPECGTALTPRNRVTGLRSRWRMAIATVALLLIGGAWWFGEGRVPRIGWVSQKMQWHWAVHEQSIMHPDSYKYFQWYDVHGGQRVSRVTIDVAAGQHSALAQLQFDGSKPRCRECEIDLRDEMRAWGRFQSSDAIWHVDVEACTIVRDGPMAGVFALPVVPGSDCGWMTYTLAFGTLERQLVMRTAGGELIGEYRFMPDPTGSGWFYMMDNTVVHHDLVTGALTDAVDVLEHLDPSDRSRRVWSFQPVMGSKSLAIVYGENGLLIDLESRKALQRVDRQYILNEVAIALIAAGEDDIAVRNAQVPFGGWTGARLLTSDRSYLVSQSVQTGIKVAGRLAQTRWQYRLVDPTIITPGSDELITTGPGPRDVNVFYIVGGQLILAVYVLPEAE